MPVAFLYNRKRVEGEMEDVFVTALSEVPFDTVDGVRKEFYVALKDFDLKMETGRQQDKLVGVLAAEVQATAELSAGGVHVSPKRIESLNACLVVVMEATLPSEDCSDLLVEWPVASTWRKVLGRVLEAAALHASEGEAGKRIKRRGPAWCKVYYKHIWKLNQRARCPWGTGDCSTLSRKRAVMRFTGDWKKMCSGCQWPSG